MAVIASGPEFFMSWVIRLENFGILQEIVEGYGLTATIVKENDKDDNPLIPQEGD